MAPSSRLPANKHSQHRRSPPNHTKSLQPVDRRPRIPLLSLLLTLLMLLHTCQPVAAFYIVSDGRGEPRGRVVEAGDIMERVSGSVPALYLLELGEEDGVDEGGEDDQEPEMVVLEPVGVLDEGEEEEEEEPLMVEEVVLVQAPSEGEDDDEAELVPMRRERRRVMPVHPPIDEDQLMDDAVDELELLSRSNRMRHALEKRASQLEEEILSGLSTPTPAETLAAAEVQTPITLVTPSAHGEAEAVADGGNEGHFPPMELNPLVLMPIDDEPEAVYHRPTSPLPLMEVIDSPPEFLSRARRAVRPEPDPALVEILEQMGGGNYDDDELEGHEGDERQPVSFIVV